MTCLNVAHLQTDEPPEVTRALEDDTHAAAAIKAGLVLNTTWMKICDGVLFLTSVNGAKVTCWETRSGPSGVSGASFCLVLSTRTHLWPQSPSAHRHPLGSNVISPTSLTPSFCFIIATADMLSCVADLWLLESVTRRVCDHLIRS